ncbi:MAG: poly[(R)-3-hydroxyalkanoate] polymerase subunit PhaC, partial [Thermoleophilaceae bacterium]|nr:poly[(R)-3-hydroxyalkanoate] polymerase subunit PhaC [Thermoleophilaceae bacterium]
MATATKPRSKAKPRTKAKSRSKPSSNGSGRPAPGSRGAERPSGATGLDAMLTDAATTPARRLLPGRAVAKVGARLALRPDKLARGGLGLSAELARIAIGRSDVEPPKGDRRWKDPAWV